MSIQKISDAEFKRASVSSLPIRPNSSSLYGGTSLSATELRAAFDKAPALIMAKLNELIDSVTGNADGDGHISRQIMTGLSDGHTLGDLFRDIISGELSKYLYVGDETLYNAVSRSASERGDAVKSITYDIESNKILYRTTDGEEFSVSLPESGIDSYVAEKKQEISGYIENELDGFRYADFGGEAASFALEAEREYALSGFSALSVSLPSPVVAGFCSIVHFSVADATKITLPETANVMTASGESADTAVIYLGDDVSGVSVSLCDGYRYTLMFIHDGEALTCTVNRRAI